MSWKPIVVGVDTSPEAASAAAFASRMADMAGTTCHLVHSARDVWAAVPVDEGVDELKHALIDNVRADIRTALKGVDQALIESLTVRLGRAPVVLRGAVSELGAELVVLGGKHHSTLGRWLAGSTSLNVARTADVPLLVTAGAARPIRRVLVAVDVSSAATPTLAAAERYAALFGAELRALNALEPLPVIPVGSPAFDQTAYYALSEDLLRREVWPRIQAPWVEKVMRHGTPVETIEAEVAAWRADLLVVGSHGKGWVQRMLLGSVTERLLNHLPTSVLVVPTAAAVVEPLAASAERSQPVVAIG